MLRNCKAILQNIETIFYKKESNKLYLREQI
jgi:hypothetical protein